jgi:hypothetical protein
MSKNAKLRVGNLSSSNKGIRIVYKNGEELGNFITNEEVSKLIKEILKLDPSFPSNLIHQPEYIKYNELEFFTSNSGSNYPSLFDKINKTYTQLGRFNLMNIILHPITNYDILEKRKNIITYFETNKHIYIEIIEKLKKLKTLENDVMWFFKTRSPEMDKVLEIVYFQNWINFKFPNLLFG